MQRQAQTQHFFGGVKHADGIDHKPVTNPATGEVISSVVLAGYNEVNSAVLAAKAALPLWSSLSPVKRAQYLFEFRSVVRERRQEIAEAISTEHGKTIDDALGEVTRALEVIEYATGITTHLSGSFSREVASFVDVTSQREALGIVAGITPFNFPFMVPLWMIPMAIACGNTFILKPSEQCPTAANLIIDLVHQAGIPAGVVNTLHGDKRAVDAILAHPDIEAVSFVGSTPIADYIYTEGCKHSKRVQALGGAKNHLIVMPDADLDEAADALMGAGYGAAGERCMAISVAVPVGQEVANALRDKLLSRIEKLKIGPASDEHSEMGPVISKQHQERILDLIQSGIDAGANLVADGRQYSVPGFDGGYWLGACLFDNVEPGMRIYDEEIFGPVLSMVRRDDLDSALELINSNPYANGTSIFTESGSASRYFRDRVKVGMVGINIPIPVPIGFHSFGGWKKSSFGSHGIYGPEAVHFYTRLKTVTSRWGKRGEKAGASFSFNQLNKD